MNLSLLKELFANFIRTRGWDRHFRRLALFESLAGTTVSREIPQEMSQILAAAAKSDVAALLKHLDSHADGLSHPRAWPDCNWHLCPDRQHRR